ncbi:aminopeptidase N [Thioalkalivibrio denitrificans]|uniref:aminopeptidase N n=1 Tax=Thioalkalivibrio denitrificans TaxID=108003 RepID=UPI001FE396E1|nr:aminopeptidase N [Thioalkalivibrio denitrificans]
MKDATPRAVFLKDYTPPAWRVLRVDLDFRLGPERTRVRSRLSLARISHHPSTAAADLRAVTGRAPSSRLDVVSATPAPSSGPRAPSQRHLDALVTNGGEICGLDRRAGSDQPLVLYGQDLALLAIAVDGRALPRGAWRQEGEQLWIEGLPSPCELTVETEIRPSENTALEGLYVSGGNFCTQCEAEGFRRITWFPDRPDVMAQYTVRMEADKAAFPVLLSNGNLTEKGDLPEGRHYAVWHDPFPKPSYLFALVAGDLACQEDRFVTRSGREVALRIYVQHHNLDKCGHAMRSLKKAMRWDEDTFGREYDLDVYMIVAVDDFNMGAMENKGLNIFNSKYVLARPDTATDEDFVAIESVIAHEYFHNWSGNRVTCRDWFQLSLKEGLTVYRDQEFTADQSLRTVKRIDDVQRLRSLQFPEDAGPMAHPVRPQSYMEINNFYTMTVYEKGAEVVRMIRTLLGREGFRRGLDLYFERHDGQAVTTDDFVSAMEDASARDLTQFRRWYDQAGTPVLDVSGEYDAEGRRCRLTVRQSCPSTPGQKEKLPLHIPLAVALLDSRGREIPLRLEGEKAASGGSRVLELTAPDHVFVFEDVYEAPVPSLLRDFSAPVTLRYPYTDEELAFLMASDTDEFNRWEAGQQYAVRVLLRLVADVQANRPLVMDEGFIAAAGRVLENRDLDPALVAEALGLPGESYLADQMKVVDVDAIHAARQFARQSLGRALGAQWQALYERHGRTDASSLDATVMGSRRLANLALAYLVMGDPATGRALAHRQFLGARNMTETMGALRALMDCACEELESALAAFESRWRDEPLVLDKWFSLQAASSVPGALERVRRLMSHPGFNIRNPNRVRALIGAFVAANPVHFHAADGSGYEFLAEQVLTLDPMNPQVAARLVKALSRWRRFDRTRQAAMRSSLERIVAIEGLSRDVYEIASRSLE